MPTFPANSEVDMTSPPLRAANTFLCTASISVSLGFPTGVVTGGATGGTELAASASCSSVKPYIKFSRIMRKYVGKDSSAGTVVVFSVVADRKHTFLHLDANHVLAALA